MATDTQQCAVASSSTLWAQASKDWVIPAKPKPGRKPKKDALQQPAKEPIDDSKGRRVQNRAAQRAFRERKQSQLAELQARVQQFEQGEIERNVALQQVAKRLKEENEQLKSENGTLKDEIATLKQRLAETAQVSLPTTGVTKIQSTRLESTQRSKRWRDESLSSLATDDTGVFLEDPNARKRFRPDNDDLSVSLTPAPRYGRAVSYYTSPPSMASSPDSNGVTTAPYSPLPFPGSTVPHTSSAYAPSEAIQDVIGDSLKNYSLENLDCGLCADGGVCMCKALALDHTSSAVVNAADRQVIEVNRFSASREVLKIEEIESSLFDSVSRTLEGIAGTVQERAPPARTNAPYQIRLPSPEATPAPIPSKRSLPLRHRAPTKRTTSGKVWQIQSDSPTPPMCSGDPTNCPACKDDDFGRAFCVALGSASGAGVACASCPNPEACGKVSRASYSNATNFSAPVGAPGTEIIDLTGKEGDEIQGTSGTSASPSPSIGGSTSLAPSNSTPSSGDSALSKTIPVNEAWKRLKSHPNIAFADLSMLADVVARRVKCSGPVAVINPAPGTVTPERDAARSPAVPDLTADQAKQAHKDNGPVLLTDPYRVHEEPRTRASSPAPGSSARLSSAGASRELPQEQMPTPEISVPPPLPLGPRKGDKPLLVPQEQLRECGRRRIREVDAAGVNDALRILDAQFGKHA